MQESRKLSRRGAYGSFHESRKTCSHATGRARFMLSVLIFVHPSMMRILFHAADGGRHTACAYVRTDHTHGDDPSLSLESPISAGKRPSRADGLRSCYRLNVFYRMDAFNIDPARAVLLHRGQENNAWRMCLYHMAT